MSTNKILVLVPHMPAGTWAACMIFPAKIAGMVRATLNILGCPVPGADLAHCKHQAFDAITYRHDRLLGFIRTIVIHMPQLRTV